jgi:hypothetical protein
MGWVRLGKNLSIPLFSEFTYVEYDTTMGWVRLGKHLSIPLFSEFTYVEYDTTMSWVRLGKLFYCRVDSQMLSMTPQWVGLD